MKKIEEEMFTREEVNNIVQEHRRTERERILELIELVPLTSSDSNVWNFRKEIIEVVKTTK